MVSVDPQAIRFLQKSAAPQEELEEDPEEETPDKETGASSEASAENDTASEPSTDEAATTDAAPSDAEPASSKPAPPKPSHPSKYRSRLLGMTGLTPFHLPPYASPFIFVPPYLEPYFATCSVVYLRHPTARPGYSEIPTPWDADGSVVRLAWEWYSKRRPRIRSKRQLARMPENRQ